MQEEEEEEVFEGYFLLKNYFYLFSKEEGKTVVYKVPNEKGAHKAKKIGSHKFHEKQSKVTSAAISDNGSTVVLLNHYRLWKLTDFSEDDFFSRHENATMLYGHVEQAEHRIDRRVRIGLLQSAAHAFRRPIR